MTYSEEYLKLCQRYKTAGDQSLLTIQPTAGLKNTAGDGLIPFQRHLLGPLAPKLRNVKRIKTNSEMQKLKKSKRKYKS